MKTQLQFAVSLILCFIFIGCTPMYQVMETKSKEANLKDGWLVTDYNGISIAYNFWDLNGRVSYVLTNNTDLPIYLDWDRSHFIFNGVSYEYWFDEEQTKSFYHTSTSSAGTPFAVAFINALAGYPTSYYSYDKKTESATTKFKPKKVIELPPHSALYVSKFTITKDIYYTCDFHMKYKSARKSESVSFSEESTPVYFRNYLTISKEPDFKEASFIDDGFYVAAIHNMNYNVFRGKQKSEKFCTVDGNTGTRTYYTLPYKKPDSFYLRRLK